MMRSIYPDVPVSVRLLDEDGKPWGKPQVVSNRNPTRRRRYITWTNTGKDVSITGWEAILVIKGLASVGINPTRRVVTPLPWTEFGANETLTLDFKQAGLVKVT